jgi:hypothetical protein
MLWRKGNKAESGLLSYGPWLVWADPADNRLE